MRILLGYTPDGLHPETAECVANLLPGAERVDVSGDTFAYWRAVEERWTGDDDLMVIEQDIVIHDQVLPQFGECPGDWCTFAYPIFNSGQRLIQGLGCARFSAALQRKVPAAEFLTDGRIAHPDGEGVPWEFLDLVIANRLRTGHGLKPHVHEPDVTHLHDYTGAPVIGRSGTPWGDHPRDSPLAVYHRPVKVLHDPAPRPPAIQVYGAAMSPVSSADDAARLANALTARYLNDDGTSRDVPAQLDLERPAAVRFGSDKIQQGYLPSYLRIAAGIGTAGRACEVGVWQGDSLQMWQALFPGGIVCGVDIDERALWPREADQVIASQDDPELPARLAAISPAGWDLIVDDASHQGELTAATFALLWPLVVPGGWYVIEDWFVGFGKHPLFPGDGSMLRTVESLLWLLEDPRGETESVEFRYGMAILRKRA